MISKQEVLEIARALNLHPHIVEKDYALGWVLAGIYAHPDLKDVWVFKGGTCLKKCYFETYRFSEDLDFTLTESAHLDSQFLAGKFAEVSEWIYEQSGLELPIAGQDFEIYQNPRGRPSCRGRLSTRGPVSPSSGGLPRVKLDITADEVVALAPVRQPIFHPYSDAPEGGTEVLSYAYEEVFAEKVRALGERARPRDLYDVIHLFRNEDLRPTASVLADVLERKCKYKQIRVPRFNDVQAHLADLEAGWHSMLAHQLPSLPPVESFLDALREFFDWLEGKAIRAVPASYGLALGETVIRERVPSAAGWGTDRSFLEVIRFAAANRLCVDLDYKGLTRRIEPYSLRRTKAEHIVLHAWDVTKNDHRSYRLDRVEGARVSNQTFTPRYAVELTPNGPLSIPATHRSADPGAFDQWGESPFGSRRKRRSQRRNSILGASDRRYIYECPMCGKKFRRKKPTNRLNPHKGADGFPCHGRTAYLQEFR